MAIGLLEPLYRYLKLRDEQDPIEAIMGDMEQLAKGGYIKNLREGIHCTVTNNAINAEIAAKVKEASQERVAEPTMFFQTHYQGIGNKMYITVSHVGERMAKTSLALCINENDTVDVLFIEPDAFTSSDISGKTLYSSISTVVVGSDGQLKNGFLRCETTFGIDSGTGKMAIKCDFKLSRTTPFYISLASIGSASVNATVGDAAKAEFTRMESTWTA